MPPLLNKTTDQRIVHHGTWEQFKFIQKDFDGSPGVRLFYYDGAYRFSFGWFARGEFTHFRTNYSM